MEADAFQQARNFSAMGLQTRNYLSLIISMRTLPGRFIPLVRVSPITFRQIFLPPNPLKGRKKNLPNVAISGIPRLHVATGLPSIGNYVASRHFQRSRARAGAGPFRIASCESRAGDQEGYCASGHEGNGARVHKEIGTSNREETGQGDREKAGTSDREKAGASDHQGFDANVYDRAGATNRETKHKRSDAACYALQLQNPAGQKGISSRHHAVLSEPDRVPVCQGRSAYRSQADASGDDRAGTRPCAFAIDVLALCKRGVARFRRYQLPPEKRTRQRRGTRSGQ